MTSTSTSQGSTIGLVGCLLCVRPSLVSSFHMGGTVAGFAATRRQDLQMHYLNALQSIIATPKGSSLALSAASDTADEASDTANADASSTATPPMSISEATQILRDFDAKQQAFMKDDGMEGMGGGTSAFKFLTSAVTKEDRLQVQQAVCTLVQQAHVDRSKDSSRGRIMLGICASNAPEALGGLKSWVSTLALPRGMLHGMDVDGVPIPPEELGSVYVKFSTGGAMTFKQMRESKMGFDALWRPGDALLEPYDGDFRGVYLNVELEDGEFRQFGVLPTDLFMDLDEDW